MITKNKLISDVVLQLTQGSPSDDFQVEEAQIAQWATYHLNELVRREISAFIGDGRMIPPIYLKREEGLSMTEEDIVEIDDINQRMWLELTEEVLDLPKDSGVVQVLDYDYNLVYKASLERMQMLNAMRFARPSQENKVYYRQGNKVFVEGFRTAEIDFNKIIVDYIPKQDVFSMSDDSEILISDQLVPILIDQLVQRGKLELYGTQPDTASDGTDSKQTAYHTAISNPSKRQQQETEE
jgi:hypothetical protein